jgi:hypothetical protein
MSVNIRFREIRKLSRIVFRWRHKCLFSYCEENGRKLSGARHFTVCVSIGQLSHELIFAAKEIAMNAFEILRIGCLPLFRSFFIFSFQPITSENLHWNIYASPTPGTPDPARQFSIAVDVLTRKRHWWISRPQGPLTPRSTHCALSWPL